MHGHVLIRILCGFGMLTAVSAPLWAQSSENAAPPTAAKSGEPGAGEESAKKKKSTAERIVDLERNIAQSEKELADLKSSLDQPDSEFANAKAEFTELDEKLAGKKKALEEARKAGDAEQVTSLQQEVDDLQKPRDLAKDRFDLALEEEAAVKEKIVTLEKKVQQDREALKKLSAGPTTQPAEPAKTPPAATPPEGAAPGGVAEPSAEPSQPAAPPPGLPGIPPAAPGAATPAGGPPPDKKEPDSKELAEAREEVQAKTEAVKQAEAEVASINERIETLQAEIQSIMKLLETGRKMAQVAREQQKAAREQARKRMAEGAPQAEINELWEKMAAAEDRSTKADAEVRERRDKMDALESDLMELQAERIAALEQAEKTRLEAEAARKAVESLESPLNLQNIWAWIVRHGPPVVGIILGAFCLLWLAQFIAKRMVNILVGKSDHGTRMERENRAQTLASVFKNVAYLVIIIGAILMILTEIDIQIGPLLGGAAVVGLAVAFGAQNLIKDYFYGFIILLENQYTINDVIRIGDASGLVERITLRMTVLRDLEGTVHFIPHGEASKVANLTHGWSRSVLDIGVSYNEDADHVMEVLTAIGWELYEDPEFKPLMISAPEILGLDSMGDSAIIIKVMVKTRPLQQWTIKRQFLRRIKKKFDEVGIEIPYPHRTVYHRWEEDQRPVRLFGTESHASGDGAKDGNQKG